MPGVLDVVKPIQHFIKFPKIWIDNTTFRLHAKVRVNKRNVVQVMLKLRAGYKSLIKLEVNSIRLNNQNTLMDLK